MSAPVDLQGKKPVAADDRYEYTNAYLDEELSFEPVEDEVVASLTGSDETASIRSLNADDRSAIKLVEPDRGFAILEVSAPDVADDLEAGLRSAAAGNATGGNVLPVMKDADGNRRYFMPDELTVQFLEEVSEDDALAVIAEHGSTVVQAHRTTGYYTISVPEGKGMFETLRVFASLDTVEFAEPSEIGIDDALAVIDEPELGNGAIDLDLLEGLDTDPEIVVDDEPIVEPGLDTASVTEPMFNRLWGLRNVGQTLDGVTGTVDSDIDGSLAWRIQRGSPNVVVAVLDTGADLDHPDLAPRLLPRGGADWDFADPADSVPTDAGDHGSHVAGTAVAASNGTGMVGVAPGARLMPLRINLTAGMNANRADAINYVADRARAEAATRNRYVINCSWRASGNISAILRAIRRAVARNVVVVFAAGNSNRDMDVQPQFPGAYPEVISVAATDQSDRRASFSNFGSTIDVSAPGVNIWSTVPNDTHGYKDGTSMAAPHVAGLAALIWSRNETLSAAEVRDIIESTTDDIDAGNPGFAGKLGTGRINAYRALRNTPAPVRRPAIARTLAFPQVNAGSSTGLAFAPQFWFFWRGIRPAVLFLTQQAGSERVYFLNPITGAVGHSVDPAANDTVGSLSWDAGQIWMANVTTGSGSINRVNPYSGALVSSIPAPAGRGEGMVHDGARLYYSTQNRIHVLSPSTGAVVSSFIPPGGPVRALAAGGGKLFLGDSTNGVIRVLDAGTRIEQVILEAPGGGDRQVEGLAYDPARRELYVANQSENRIYVIRA
ncbi:MAG: S8 family serine peptidase [Actinomycetota bacterium]